MPDRVAPNLTPARSFRLPLTSGVLLCCAGSSHYARSAMQHSSVSTEIAAALLARKKRIEAAKIPPSKLDETMNAMKSGVHRVILLLNSKLSVD